MAKNTFVEVNIDLQFLNQPCISYESFLTHRSKGSYDFPCSGECIICGLIFCGEPLHFHHDGCPSCFNIRSDSMLDDLDKSHSPTKVR